MAVVSTAGHADPAVTSQATDQLPAAVQSAGPAPAAPATGSGSSGGTVSPPSSAGTAIPNAPEAVPTPLPVAQTAALTVAADGKYCVEATIDGKGPYSLLIDTGCEILVLKDTVAKALGLAVRTGTVEVKGPTGGYVPVGQADIDTVGIAGFTLKRPFCVVEPIDHAYDGIIGAPLLNAGVVQLDLPGRKLVTYAPGAFRPESDDIALPITFGKLRVPIVDGAVGAIPATIEIDTGSSFPMELLPAFIHANHLAGAYQKVGTVGRKSISGATYSDVYSVDTVTLGRAADPPAGSAGGADPVARIGGPIPTVFIDPDQAPAETEFDGRIGYPLLEGVRLTLDYPHSMVYVHLSPVSPPSTATATLAQPGATGSTSTSGQCPVAAPGSEPAPAASPAPTSTTLP